LKSHPLVESQPRSTTKSIVSDALGGLDNLVDVDNLVDLDRSVDRADEGEGREEAQLLGRREKERELVRAINRAREREQQREK